MIVVAGIMIFYAVGIITNFFAQPMFSMFFIVSNQTAHTLVVYIAIGAAVAISTLAAVIHFRKPKTFATEATNKLIVTSMQMPMKAEVTINPTIPLIQMQMPIKTPQMPIKTSSASFTYKMSSDSERYAANLAAKKKLNSTPPPQITSSPKPETVIIPEIKALEIQKIPEKPKVKPETKKEASKNTNKDKTDKMICQHCKKEFSTPMMMLDYSTSYPTLVSHCPYCFEPVRPQKAPE